MESQRTWKVAGVLRKSGRCLSLFPLHHDTMLNVLSWDNAKHHQTQNDMRNIHLYIVSSYVPIIGLIYIYICDCNCWQVQLLEPLIILDSSGCALSSQNITDSGYLRLWLRWRGRRCKQTRRWPWWRASAQRQCWVRRWISVTMLVTWTRPTRHFSHIAGQMVRRASLRPSPSHLQHRPPQTTSWPGNESRWTGATAAKPRAEVMLKSSLGRTSGNACSNWASSPASWPFESAWSEQSGWHAPSVWHAKHEASQRLLGHSQIHRVVQKCSPEKALLGPTSRCQNKTRTSNRPWLRHATVSVGCRWCTPLWGRRQERQGPNRLWSPNAAHLLLVWIPHRCCTPAQVQWEPQSSAPPSLSNPKRSSSSIPGLLRILQVVSL